MNQLKKQLGALYQEYEKYVYDYNNARMAARKSANEYPTLQDISAEGFMRWCNGQE